MVRYLAALAVMVLTMLAGGALLLAPAALGLPPARHWSDPARVDLLAGGTLALLGLAGVTAWSVAWYRRLRADGVWPPATARPSPRDAEDLTPVLMPLVAALAGERPEPDPAPREAR